MCIRDRPPTAFWTNRTLQTGKLIAVYSAPLLAATTRKTQDNRHVYYIMYTQCVAVGNFGNGLKPLTHSWVPLSLLRFTQNQKKNKKLSRWWDSATCEPLVCAEVRNSTFSHFPLVFLSRIRDHGILRSRLALAHFHFLWSQSINVNRQTDRRTSCWQHKRNMIMI